MTARKRQTLLDGRGARIVAIAIALAGLAFLGWIHRDDLFPPEPGSLAGDPRQAAFKACFAPQAARIDRDEDSGRIDAEQAALFRSRAEALCADQANKSGTGPGLPRE